MAGLFGKLPAHGDFISRQLPQGFIQVWDEWLQCVVAGSRNQLGDSWLDYYLTSPVWRFALRPGVVDENAWAGVLVPSVDSVGRYFPLTLAEQLPGQRDLFTFLAEDTDWFAAIEAVALASLQQGLTADEVLEQLEQCQLDPQKTTSKVSGRGTVVLSGNRNSLFSGALPLVLQERSPYSLWASMENENAPAMSVVSTGLPTPDEYSSMISGDWQETTVW